MPKEKETYRKNYEMLKEQFPDKTILTIKEIMALTGWGRNRVVRDVPLNDHKWTTIASFAHFLSV